MTKRLVWACFAAVVVVSGAIVALASTNRSDASDVVRHAMATPFPGAYGVVVQPDGKIVAGGTTQSFPNTKFALARYRPNGTLDHTFGGDGKVTTATGSYSGALGIAIQADGDIVAAGGALGRFTLARYRPNGTLDHTFGGDGTVTLEQRGAFTAVAIQGDGKIVAVGGSRRNRFAVARLEPNGTLDSSFGGDGTVATAIGKYGAVAQGVATQPDGKIVVVGDAEVVGGRERFALARYRPNGTLDPAFGGGDGKLTTSVGTWDSIATTIAIQSDGKIVVGGGAYYGSPPGFTLARYRSTGALDPTFGGGDGKVFTRMSTAGLATALAIQSDGKLVVVGGGFALARYRSNGTLDPTFGGDGKVTTRVDRGIAQAVAIQPDGRIVVAGASGFEFALSRYRSTGALDHTFGGDGKVVTGIGPSPSPSPSFGQGTAP